MQTLLTSTINFPIQQQQNKSIGCGLDHSCPTSVTTPTGQDVRLDQYQSRIRGKTKTCKRQKQQIVPDHKFEWYDLDAIYEVDTDTVPPIIIRHDFYAGLLFTTDRQVLRKEMQVNVGNPSSVGIQDHKSSSSNSIRQDFEVFDLSFWFDSEYHNKARETLVDREFRERMEELEEEVGTCDLTSLSSSSSTSDGHFSLSFSSSSNCSSLSSSFNHNEHNEAKNEFEIEIDIDIDGSNRSFISSWHFEDAKIPLKIDH